MGNLGGIVNRMDCIGRTELSLYDAIIMLLEITLIHPAQ